MLYFDHCATTPLYEEVIESISEVMKHHYGNPSSIHRLGMEAEKLVQTSREVIGEYLKVRPQQLIFTSGGTESNNLAVKGAAFHYRGRGNHLITSAIEHSSVLECFRQLEQQHDFEVTYLPVDESGSVRLTDLSKAVKDSTVLISIMHVNNEMGRIQPVDEIGRWLKAHHPKIIFHVDAVQSIGKIVLDPERSGIDLMSLSAHKIRGPKGIGVLYKKQGLLLSPLLSGGGQEFGERSGTENVPLIVGMAKAIRMTMENLEANRRHLALLRETLIQRIRSIPGLTMTGSDNAEDMAPHIVHFCYPGIKSEVMVHALEQSGIYISSKSACSSGEEKPSRVLLAMGYAPPAAASGLRISLSPMHTEEDICFLSDQLRQVIKKFSF